MNIPEQLHIRDLIIYILTGSLYLCTFTFLAWNLFDYDVFEVFNNTILFYFSWSIIAYIIGVSTSNFAFSFMINLTINTQPKKIFISTFRFIFMINSHSDYRILDYFPDELSKIIIRNKIVKLFECDKESLENFNRIELFYLIHRYVDNFSTSQGFEIIHRRHLLTNFFARMVIFYSYCLVICPVLILIKTILYKGKIDCIYLALTSVVFFILTRLMINLFQKSLKIWHKNIWRLFLVINIK